MSNTTNKKMKYHETCLDRALDVNTVLNAPGVLPSVRNHQNSNVNIESNLIHPETTYKKKQQYELDPDEQNKFNDYRNFGLTSLKIRNNLDHSDYIKNGFKGHGRGFGDLNIDLELRYGHNSRLAKKDAVQQDLTELRFHDLYYSFNDPDNSVLPFGRAGVDTRNLDKLRK